MILGEAARGGHARCSPTRVQRTLLRPSRGTQATRKKRAHLARRNRPQHHYHHARPRPGRKARAVDGSRRRGADPGAVGRAVGSASQHRVSTRRGPRATCRSAASRPLRAAAAPRRRARPRAQRPRARANGAPNRERGAAVAHASHTSSARRDVGGERVRRVVVASERDLGRHVSLRAGARRHSEERHWVARAARPPRPHPRYPRARPRRTSARAGQNRAGRACPRAPAAVGAPSQHDIGRFEVAVEHGDARAAERAAARARRGRKPPIAIASRRLAQRALHREPAVVDDRLADGGDAGLLGAAAASPPCCACGRAVPQPQSTGKRLGRDHRRRSTRAPRAPARVAPAVTRRRRVAAQQTGGARAGHRADATARGRRASARADSSTTSCAPSSSVLVSVPRR